MEDVTLNDFEEINFSENGEIITSELVYDAFDNCYNITTYAWTYTDHTGTYSGVDVVITQIPCPGGNNKL